MCVAVAGQEEEKRGDRGVCRRNTASTSPKGTKKERDFLVGLVYSNEPDDPS